MCTQLQLSWLKHLLINRPPVTYFILRHGPWGSFFVVGISSMNQVYNQVPYREN